MNKKRILQISLLAVSLLATVGFSVGLTYAAYSWGTKTYEFNADTENVTIRDVKHYFDSSTEGNGTSTKPYIISNPTHLRNLAKLTNYGVFGTSKYYFKMAHSFNWSGDDMEPIGKDADHAFYGMFVGGGHTIKGLTVNATGEYAGMFGYVATSTAGAIENLILSSPKIKCNPTTANTSVTAGFVAGYVYGSSGSGHVRKIMIYGGNEVSGDWINRATITGNSNAKVTSSAASKSLIVGGYPSGRSGNIDTTVSFVAKMGDIIVGDNGALSLPTGSGNVGYSSQSSLNFSNATNFTYSYYRHTGESGATTKVS